MATGLLKPILQEPGNFDATKSCSLNVSIPGYENFTSITLRVYNYDGTGTEPVYTKTQTYAETINIDIGAYFITIPADTLGNGTRYYANVQTSKTEGTETVQSSVSNNVLFICFKPSLSQITPITQTITTSNVKITYSYKEDFGFPVETLNFELYKLSGSGSFDVSAGHKVKGEYYINSSDFEYSVVFTDLEPNTNYLVQAAPALYGYTPERNEGTVVSSTFSTGDFVTPSGIISISSKDCKGIEIIYATEEGETFTNVRYVVIKTKSCVAKWGEDWRIIKKITPLTIRTNPSVVDYMSDIRSNVKYAVVFQYTDGTESGQLTSCGFTSPHGKLVISDREKGYAFSYSLSYDNTTLNQNVGVYVPYSQQFPVFISNGKNKYKTGGFTAKVLTKELLEQVTTQGLQNAGANNIRKLTEEFLAWLTDKQSPVKILKDGNGNYLMVRFNDNPSISYDNSFGQQIITVSASWTESGDVDNQKDWIKNKLAEEPVAVITS